MVDTRFADQKMMGTPGNSKAMIVFGRAGNTVTRMPKAAEGIEKLDLLVVADPHPTIWAVLGERRNDTHLLPAASQL